MCILAFHPLAPEISKLKDEKTLMHNVHSGSHPLSSYGWLELLPGWLDFLPGWLESLPGWLESFLDCWSLFLAG